MVEALLFASAEPLSAEDLAGAPAGGQPTSPGSCASCSSTYAARGVNLVQVGGQVDVPHRRRPVLPARREAVEQKQLSRAALETLAIIAYHQPVTRAEIEEIRGVATSRARSTCCWRPAGSGCAAAARAGPAGDLRHDRAFLMHFGLDTIGDLPGLDELKGAGLLDSPGFRPISPCPMPSDDAATRPRTRIRWRTSFRKRWCLPERSDRDHLSRPLTWGPKGLPKCLAFRRLP